MKAGINRRQFLKLSVAATAPALRRQTSPAAGLPVVVVGAGLAGLRAATLLKRAGRPVVVLEARSRPGGRVFTVRAPFDAGLYAEAGAARIPGVHRAVLQAVREHRLSLVPFESSTGSRKLVDSAPSSAVRSESGLHPHERGLAPDALLERYVGTLPDEMTSADASQTSYAKWREYDRLSWPAWLASRGASPEAVRLMTLGGDARDLSALYVLRQYALLRESSQRFKIAGGMDRLPGAMATALGDLVRYNAAVVRVVRGPAVVRVDYDTGSRVESIGASRVILAVPFSTLRELEIRPRFSRVRERMIDELPYHSGTRILVQSKTRFWNRVGLNGSARTARAELWDCTYDQRAGAGILGASAGGEIGRRFLELSEQDSLTFGVELVADAFPEIRGAFEKGVVVRWLAERWSRGSIAAFRPGQMTAMMPEIARPEDRVHFAGEHTSSWMGWMEGALESGERAAREAIAA